MAANPDLVRILESVYQVEQSRDGWLEQLLTAANGELGLGCGVGAVLYRLSNEGAVDLEGITGVGITEQWRQVGVDLHTDAALAHSIHQSYKSWPLAGTFRLLLPLTVSDVEHRRQVEQAYAHYGVKDQLIVHARESSGVGIVMLVFSNNELRLGRRAGRQLQRVATHLSTAYRLHRRLSTLASPAVEAVLDTKFRVAHAEPTAQSRAAREHLSEAARLRAWAQGRIRHDQPERAIHAWQGLVSARWTLVDQVDSDGARYILARENVQAPRAGAGLSQREREVAALAALDRSNKVIAYELGIAHSTVRVLLGRACAKLGVQSRKELVAKLGDEGGVSAPPQL